MAGLALPYAHVRVDVENYSPGGLTRHVLLERKLRRVLKAVRDVTCRMYPGVARFWITRLDGDSAVMLVPALVPKAWVAADLVRELRLALQDENAGAPPDHRVRLRAAIDHGEAVVDTLPRGGDALVRVARLCDAGPLRSALAAVPAAHLALIVSGRFFDDVIRNRERDLDPTAFRRVLVRAKKFEEYAYLQVPGLPLDYLPHFADEPAEAAGADW